MGSGMEEIFQITSALKYLDFGKHVAVITDARFSGVSTGACIGHVTPEALAGGPLGKVREGDIIEIVIDRVKLEGSVNLVVNGNAEEGARVLAARPLARRSGARSGAAGRDAPVGGAAGRQRRHLGRLCLRRGSDRPAAGGKSIDQGYNPRSATTVTSSLRAAPLNSFTSSTIACTSASAGCH